MNSIYIYRLAIYMYRLWSNDSAVTTRDGCFGSEKLVSPLRL